MTAQEDTNMAVKPIKKKKADRIRLLQYAE